MTDDAKKAEYAPPASQVDLEERQKTGNKSFRELTTSDTYEPPEDEEGGREFAVEGNKLDDYVATSPEYMTYANKTEKPGASNKGPEAQVFKEFDEAMNRPAPKAKEEEKEESSDSSTSTTSTSTSGSSSS